MHLKLPSVRKLWKRLRTGSSLQLGRLFSIVPSSCELWLTLDDCEHGVLSNGRFEIGVSMERNATRRT